MLDIDTENVSSRSPISSSRSGSPKSTLSLASGKRSPIALDGGKQTVNAVNRVKAAAAWTYPEGFLDARYQFPFAEERFFKMFYDKGVFKTIFNPPESAAIQSLVFRTRVVPPELKAKLVEVRDDANYRGVPVDDEQIRMLVNDEFREVKRSAEQELLLNQTKTAGVPIFNHIQAFIAPMGCIKNWGRDDPESYRIVAKVEKPPEKDLSLSATARRASIRDVRRSSKMILPGGKGGANLGNDASESPSATLTSSDRPSDSGRIATQDGNPIEMLPITPATCSGNNRSLLAPMPDESKQANDTLMKRATDLTNVEDAASDRPNDQLSDPDASVDADFENEWDSIEAGSGDDLLPKHSHSHPHHHYEIPTHEHSSFVSPGYSHIHALTAEQLYALSHPHPHHKPKKMKFKRDPKYLKLKTQDKLNRERSLYMNTQQELMDLRQKCDCYPFNFGAVVLQDAPEGDGVGYYYRLFFYCQASEVCRKKLTHYELDKGHWEATEDLVITHLRQQHWQQLLQTRHV